MKSPLIPSVRRTARSLFLSLACSLAAFGGLASASAATPPTVRVENIRRVFHNGEHNAFTDLIRWKGKFWLAFRSCPEGHQVSQKASVIILSSEDAKTWQQVNQFSVPGRDTRDPHFLIFGDKLFVYSGTAYVGKENIRTTEWNAHLGYATWTTDGAKWAEPKALEGTYGHYIWRAAAHGGKAYLVARRWQNWEAPSPAPGSKAGRDTMQAALLESDDGLRWRFRSFFQETQGNETSFLFEPNGELISVSRATMTSSVLGHSKPPYQKWTRETLDGFIGGPVLAKWGGHLLVGGRRVTPQGPRTTLLWLEGTQLKPFAELPSDGDNSYPGFVEYKDGRGLVSWYSTHEKGADGKPFTAIYLADLVKN